MSATGNALKPVGLLFDTASSSTIRSPWKSRLWTLNWPRVNRDLFFYSPKTYFFFSRETLPFFVRRKGPYPSPSFRPIRAPFTDHCERLVWSRPFGTVDDRYDRHRSTGKTRLCFKRALSSCFQHASPTNCFNACASEQYDSAHYFIYDCR